jgi:dCTP deaminase
MILGDRDIKNYLKRGTLKIDNLKSDSIRENGIDCRLRSEIAIDTKLEDGFIVDTHDQESISRRFVSYKDWKSIIVPPLTNILLATQEKFYMPSNLMAFCAVRSSVARNGFVPPITIMDAKFDGTLTIEAWYGGKNPIKLYSGDRFLHVIFATTLSPVENGYCGVYNGQEALRTPKVLN